MTAHKQHSPGFLALTADAKSRVHEITVDQALEAVNGGDARLIDVREDNEWDAGHARGADHLSRGIIERDIEKMVPDKDAPLLIEIGREGL